LKSADVEGSCFCPVVPGFGFGSISVSHLEVAIPSKSGAVYALGNVFAAIWGSITVTLFGILLDKDGGHQAAITAAAAVSFRTFLCHFR
jgi:hypothetical protein